MHGSGPSACARAGRNAALLGHEPETSEQRFQIREFGVVNTFRNRGEEHHAMNPTALAASMVHVFTRSHLLPRESLKLQYHFGKHISPTLIGTMPRLRSSLSGTSSFCPQIVAWRAPQTRAASLRAFGTVVPKATRLMHATRACATKLPRCIAKHT